MRTVLPVYHAPPPARIEGCRRQPQGVLHVSSQSACCTPGGVLACQNSHFVTRTPRDVVGTRSLWRRGNLVLRSHRRTRHTTASASVRLAPCESKATARKGTRKSTTCQTCAHRRHATRPRDLRASPRAANGTRPSVPIHPTSCLLYTSPSPRDLSTSRMPSSA